jgi:hypothetical protein
MVVHVLCNTYSMRFFSIGGVEKKVPRRGTYYPIPAVGGLLHGYPINSQYRVWGTIFKVDSHLTLWYRLTDYNIKESNMSLLLKKFEYAETYLALKAVSNLLRSGKLYANERFFQVSNIHAVIRFTHPGIPPGTYHVQFSGDTFANLIESDGDMPDHNDVFNGGPGVILEQMLCEDAATTQVGISNICGTLPTLPTAQIIVDRYRGKTLNVIHAGPDKPAVISAPGMTLAIKPRILKIKKLVTGIPIDVDDRLRSIAAERGTSVNKIMRDALYLYLKGTDNEYHN